MKKLIYILFGIVTLSACVTELDIEIPEKPQKQVLNGLLAADSISKIYISTSRSVNSSQKIEIIKDASVQLYEDGNYVTDLSLNYYLRNTDSIWYYSAPYILKPGSVYKISSHASGLPDVYASDVIPEQVPIENLQLEQLTEEISFFDTVRTAVISFEVNDPANTQNFYHLIVNDQSTGTNIIYTTEETSASIAAGASYVFIDSYFNGKRKKIIFTIELYNSKPVLELDFRNVSKEYYSNQQTIFLQSTTVNNPFTNPVASYNNVENGYGIIAGFNSFKAILAIK